MAGHIDLSRPILLDSNDKGPDAITVQVRKDTTAGRGDFVQFYISKALYDDAGVEQKIRLSCDITFSDAEKNPEIENIARRVALAAIPTFKAAFEYAKKIREGNLSPEKVIVRYQEDQGASSFTHRITQVCIKQSETKLQELVLGGNAQIVQENIGCIRDAQNLAARIHDVSLIGLIYNISVENALATIHTAMKDVIVKAIAELRPVQMDATSPTQSKKSSVNLPSLSSIKSRLSSLSSLSILRLPKLSAIRNIFSFCLPSKKVEQGRPYVEFSNNDSAPPSPSNSLSIQDPATLNNEEVPPDSSSLTRENLDRQGQQSNRSSSVGHSAEDQGSSGSLSLRSGPLQGTSRRQPAYVNDDVTSQPDSEDVSGDPTDSQTSVGPLSQDSPTLKKTGNIFSRFIELFNKKKPDQADRDELGPSTEMPMGSNSDLQTPESAPAPVDNTVTPPPFTTTMFAGPATPRGDQETQTPARTLRSSNFDLVPELPRPSVSDAELKNLITPVLTESLSSQLEAGTSLAPTRGNPPPVPPNDHLEEDNLESKIQVADTEEEKRGAAASSAEGLPGLAETLKRGLSQNSISSSVEIDFAPQSESEELP